MHDNVADPDPVRLEGIDVQTIPVLGDIVSARATDPAKLSIPAMVTVESPVCPTLMATLVGFAAIVKSWIVKLTVEEWAMPLLVPVRVTV